MTLEQLKILVKVVQAGSFTGAADLLGTQKSYLSRVLTQLEAELGVKLLARTTRRHSLTEAGREVYERAVGILGAVRDALLRGLGIGHLPLLIASEAVTRKRLVPVLPQWQPVPAPVHALYPSSRYLSPKVRAFIDIAVERFPASNAQARKTAERACKPARPATP